MTYLNWQLSAVLSLGLRVCNSGLDFHAVVMHKAVNRSAQQPSKGGVFQMYSLLGAGEGDGVNPSKDRA